MFNKVTKFFQENRNNVVLIIFLSVISIWGQEKFPPSNLQFKVHNINDIRLKITNYCVSSSELIDGAPAAITLNYPVNSQQEMAEHLGIWVGAKVDGEIQVSTGAAYEATSAGERGARFEMYPRFNNNDTIYSASLFQGIAAEAKPGIFFNENGLLSKQYYPKSEQDFISQYWDNKILYSNIVDAPENLDTHKPLNLHIIQRSYGWSFTLYKKVVFIDYYIINEGQKTWNDVHLGFYSDPHMGRVEGQYVDFSDDYAQFIKDKNILLNADAKGGSDGDPVNDAVVGYRFVQFSKNIDKNKLKYSFRHWVHNEDALNDEQAYEWISSGEIMSDMLPEIPAGSSMRSLMGIGSFGNLAPGDTLLVTVAVAVGDGADDMIKNSDAALSLAQNGFNVPMPPPPPQFKAESRNHGVKLDWTWLQEYKGINPEEFVDKSRTNNQKDFDGYRIYRSSEGPDGPWQMIAEYDKVNGHGYDLGLEYSIEDKGLINGIRYWYALTSFDIPDQNGDVYINSMESPVNLSVQQVIPSISRADSKTDEIYVVPNPYRTDVDYTKNPGWEYPTQNRNQWYEVDRRMAFMNLPNTCIINIYTLGGDLVKSFEHTNGSIEYWNLLNSNNHAVSTGLYYFTVLDSQGNKQIGKFVIIK